MKVHFATLGCRLNEAELQQWAVGFSKEGFSIAQKAENADLVVVNTCAVTHEATRKSKQLIKKLNSKNPDAKFVISGCFSSLEPEKVQELKGVALLINNSEKDLLVSQSIELLNLPSVPKSFDQINHDTLLERGRSRSFIKIQDGCRYKCSYCIITQARGQEKSRSIKDLVDEINTLSENGVQEAVLTGVHVGGYGSDLNTDLHALVSSLLQNTEMKRLRFASVEPWDLPPTFFELFANPRLLPHMHLPLQSGSDTVLKRMARRCRRQDFRAIKKQAQSIVPDFNISTDIIAGFPGETEAEWRQSLDFAAEMQFSHTHIFPFSPRKGTRAALFAGQIPEEIKKQRVHEMHKVAEISKQAVFEKYVGREFEVLIEKGRKSISGYTPNFLPVRIETGRDIAISKATLLKVKITGFDQKNLLVKSDLTELLPDLSSKKRLHIL